jgi:beta-phosphoglucomutase-like phosphatase (HAD superfamily)
MFEDSMKNVRAAKALGMGTVFIDESISERNIAPTLEGENESKSGFDLHVDVSISSTGEIEAMIPDLFLSPPRIPIKINEGSR